MRRQRGARGQALVEFAVILPIFILLLVGIFDLGRVVWANNSLATAAREAARFAVVHGGIEADCPQGPLSTEYGGVPLPPEDCGFTPSTLDPLVDSREGIKAAATRWLNGVGGTTTISVCYGAVTSCAGDVDEPFATNGRGTTVTVTVATTIGLAAPSLLGLGDFNLSGTSTMLVNH